MRRGNANGAILVLGFLHLDIGACCSTHILFMHRSVDIRYIHREVFPDRPQADNAKVSPGRRQAAKDPHFESQLIEFVTYSKAWIV